MLLILLPKAVEALEALESRVKILNTKEGYDTKINRNHFVFEDGKGIYDIFQILPNGSVVVKLEDYVIIHSSKLKYDVSDIIK